MKKRIGYLGGTFDPPHLGHLKVAEQAFRTLSLDTLNFLPCKASEFKMPHVSPIHRVNMLYHLINHSLVSENLGVEPIEAYHDGPFTRTIDTIRHICRDNNSEVWFIYGTDAWSGFFEWEEPLEIVRHVKIAVTERPGHNILVEPDKRIPPIDRESRLLSSTEIREGLKTNDYFKTRGLPESIRKYIKENNLYV
jgi:nicotinate-nucleotide adenylyltransferase